MRDLLYPWAWNTIALNKMSTPQEISNITAQQASRGHTEPRRFTGITRLYGDRAVQRLTQARVLVAGVGGVGSWTVEALARSGVGTLILVDLDHVTESNINRQIHALDSTVGAAKVQVMAKRAREINPEIQISIIEDFITEENASQLIQGADVVVDAVDHVLAKVGMVVACREAGIPLILSGAAGGKKDPGCVRLDDVAKTEHDALLAKLRKRLRASHGFPKNLKVPFGIPAVYCQESALLPSTTVSEAEDGPQGLSCSGYGSSVAVTATMGLRAAAWVLNHLSRSCAEPS